MEREEAFKLRLKTYNTGRPCKNGHEPLRYTKTGICVGCAKANSTKYNRRFLTAQLDDKFGVEIAVRVPTQHVAMVRELCEGLMAQHTAQYAAQLAAGAEHLRAGVIAEANKAPPPRTSIDEIEAARRNGGTVPLDRPRFLPRPST